MPLHPRRILPHAMDVFRANGVGRAVATPPAATGAQRLTDEQVDNVIAAVSQRRDLSFADNWEKCRAEVRAILATSPEAQAHEREQREAREREALVAPYKDATDRVTRLLCGLLTKLEETGVLTPTDRMVKGKRATTPGYKLRLQDSHSVEIDFDRELASWWAHHKRLDKARRERDLRATALAKLTAEEKVALGIIEDDGL